MIPNTIELANLFMGLSLAIDLAEGQRLQHAHSVTYIACRLGEELDLPESAMNSLFYTGLLHGIVTISNKHFCPLCEAVAQCEGLDLTDSLYCADQAIHLSQECWDGRGPKSLSGEDIPLLSRILALATGVEKCNPLKTDYYLWREAAKNHLAQRQGHRYDPTLVKTFNGLLADRKFSLNLLNPNSSEKLAPYRPADRISGRGKTMALLSKAFASVIDQKTSYTAHHSRDVAGVSKQLALTLGLDESVQMDMYLAGLLHDLGKVAISNEILEKRGPLTAQEFSAVKNHPHYTAVILDRIPELSRLGEVASLHHEKISGDGYYLGITGEEIPFASRIIAAADVYSALAVDRPYRKALDKRTLKAEIYKMLKDNHLDRVVVDALFSTID